MERMLGQYLFNFAMVRCKFSGLLSVENNWCSSNVDLTVSTKME